MKKFLFGLALSFLTLTQAQAVDIKISQLPLGSASTTGISDSFPYVAASVNVTKRLTLWDIPNLPTMVSTYAPKANPTFTGTVTAPTFVGALTGNATTATALAANPTDCSSNQYANAIAANGNLTCAQPSISQITGTLPVAQGGTNLTSGTSGGLLAFTGSTTIASTAAGSAGQHLTSTGTTAPAWTTATFPSTTTANQLLYSSATNTVGGLSSAATSALVTNSSSVPSLTSGSTANRVLRTDGTSVTFSQVAAATDVSGQLPAANGGTGQNFSASTGVAVVASGTFSAVAPSTSGNVLTSNGSTWISSAAAASTSYFVCSATITGSTAATRTSTSLGPFTGAAGINGPVVQLAGTGGTCQTTDADNFSFTVNNVVAGTYRVSLDFSSAVGSSKIAQFAINDGTSTVGSAQVYNGSAIDGSYWPIHVEGFVTYGSTANKTFVPYGRSDSGALGINPVDANGQMFFSLTRLN